MISKSISEGFRFAFSVKRVIPYLIIALIVSYILIDLLGTILNLIRTKTGIFRFLTSLGIYIPAFIIIGLVYLWINGAMIDQAKYYPRKRSLIKSFGYSASRYLTMFLAAILYAIITGIVSSAPYIGGLISFLMSLIFFYLYPAIIVDKKGCVDSFKRSFKVFMKYPLETFITWLLTVIIGLIIIGVFALPLIFYILGSVVDVLQGIEPVANVTVEPRALIGALISRVSTAIYSPYFIPYLFVLCVAFAFNSVFFMGTQTRLYINTRKTEV